MFRTKKIGKCDYPGCEKKSEYFIHKTDIFFSGLTQTCEEHARFFQKTAVRNW